MESNISKEDGFGLVRCFNVQVIPLQWIQDLSSLDISHLPVRCKCQFGPSLQYVDLLEVSELSENLEEKLSQIIKGDLEVCTPKSNDSHSNSTTLKRRHSSDVPASKKHCINETGIVKLERQQRDPTSQKSVVNVGYSNPPVAVTAAVIEVPISPSKGTSSPQTTQDTGSLKHVKSIHYKDLNNSSNQGFLDSLKKQVRQLKGQLEKERHHRVEHEQLVQKLSLENNRLKAVLSEYSQKRSSVPQAGKEQLQFLQELIEYYTSESKTLVSNQSSHVVTIQDSSTMHTHHQSTKSASKNGTRHTSQLQSSDRGSRTVVPSQSKQQSEQLVGVSVIMPTIEQPDIHSVPTTSTVLIKNDYGTFHAIPITTGLPMTLPMRKTHDDVVPTSENFVMAAPLHQVNYVQQSTESEDEGSAMSGDNAMEDEISDHGYSSEMQNGLNHLPNGGLRASTEGHASGSNAPYYGRTGYSGMITPEERKQEEEAFQNGVNKVELVSNSGVYIKVSDLKAIEQTPKESATALMRSLISIWYSGKLLASCSATKGINHTIKTAVFDYVKSVFPDVEFGTLQRALTSKCCEERRKIKKEYINIHSPQVLISPQQ